MRFYTEDDGWCCSLAPSTTASTSSWGGTRRRSPIAAGRRASRFARACAFGRFANDVARGLRIRCDWGPQYIADAWIKQVNWLGMTITPPNVGEPECNGVIDRFMRTLKEPCHYLHRFQSIAEAHRIIDEFITPYHTERLLERLGHQTPVGERRLPHDAAG